MGLVRTFLSCGSCAQLNPRLGHHLPRLPIRYNRLHRSSLSPRSRFSSPVGPVLHLGKRVLWECDAGSVSAGEIVGYSESEGEKLNDVGEDESSGLVWGEGGVESKSLWGQMTEIAAFAGPATGLWVCGPLMSLIDTMVIGQGSSVELAALGPGTVICDYLSYVFMFLSIATSNLVATSLARKDRNLAQHQISMLLFVALVCGVGMFLLTKFFTMQVLTAFVGADNLHIIPAASTYVQIRGLAWPAILIGMVAQSASLGMKDSLGPLKALAVASAVNGFGDILLCSVFNYGIAGAAWATMVSQVIAGYMMARALTKAGFNAFSLTLPSPKELLQIFEIAAPVFITMTSKVAFYALLTYFATAMGTITVAAHQVMINVYCMCTVWGEPLSQTAQSFMPEFITGVNRNLQKAWTLLQSLLIIGALSGLTLGAVGTAAPWFIPNAFTSDSLVIGEMHKVLLPFFIALVITPPTHCFEGTLLAGRDLTFLSVSMLSCFFFGGLLLGVFPRHQPSTKFNI
ncbi:MATE efflux family protein isoform X2 [Wolffia australiana]